MAKAPVLLGITSALVTAFVWAGSDFGAVKHDEAAYELQAEIFAHGRWSLATPEPSEFFEQTHVLIEPTLASKYPPGHSLLMSLGAMVGAVSLVSLLLTAVAGTLVYSLAVRVAGGSVGLLTWAIWTTSAQNLYWRASMFSELTTSAAILMAWWLVLRWRDRPGAATLGALAGVVAWGGITRPLTMLALSLPIAWIVMRFAIRERRWRELGLAAAVGFVVLGIWPAWSYGTLGSATRSPHSEYTEQYMPWDRIGFGLSSEEPLRQGPPDVEFLLSAQFGELHENHQPAALPGILGHRILNLLFLEFRGWRIAFLVFAVVGVFLQPRLATFLGASVAFLILAYLPYAHASDWTVYYLEILPVGCFFIAVGLVELFERSEVAVQGSARPAAGVSSSGVLVAAVLVAILGLSVPSIIGVRETLAKRAGPLKGLESCLAGVRIPAGVIVRYAPDHVMHLSLVRNVAEPATAPVITALDRGPDNDRLLRARPERIWYLYDERANTLARLETGQASSRRSEVVRTCQ
ncbi:MAG: hypothetical protein JJE01_07425 [Gemmatimonadetes bacterium]|nr:hypothetical protein [Gemmatimonadota bacterium]